MHSNNDNQETLNIEETLLRNMKTLLKSIVVATEQVNMNLFLLPHHG